MKERHPFCRERKVEATVQGELLAENKTSQRQLRWQGMADCVCASSLPNLPCHSLPRLLD